MKKIIKIITICLTILSFQPLYAGNYDLGCKFFVRKNYDKARESFLKSLEYDSHNGNALYFLGEIEKIQENYADSENYFKQAVNEPILKKYKKLAYWNLIVFTEQRGDIIGTVKICKEFWLKTKDKGAKKKIDKLINKLQWSQNEEAIKLYKDGIKNKKNAELASQYFYNALELDSNFLAARFEIGLSLLKNDNKTDAAYHFQIIANQIPFHSSVNFLLGNIYFENKSYNDAIISFTNALEYGTWNNRNMYSILLKRGTSYYKLNNYELAEKDITEASKIKKRKLDPLFILSAIYIKQDSFEQALKILEKIYSIDKKNREVIFQIGSIYYRQNNDKFSRYFDNLFLICKKSEKKLPHKYYQAFIILLKYHYSINSYRKTSEILTFMPDNYKNYELNLINAKLSYRLAKYQKAIEIFENLSLNDDDKLILAKSYKKAGFTNKAKNLILSLIAYSDFYKQKAANDKVLNPIIVQIQKEEDDRKREEERKRKKEEELRLLKLREFEKAKKEKEATENNADNNNEVENTDNSNTQQPSTIGIDSNIKADEANEKEITNTQE